jgi:integrase
VKHYASKRGFYTTYRGQRYRLRKCDEDDSPDGPNYLAALDEFKRVVERAKVVGFHEPTVEAALERWYEHLAKGAPRVESVARTMFSSFLAKHGATRVDELQPGQVLRWIEGHDHWAPATCKTALKRLKTAFNYSARGSLIKANPLSVVKLPAAWRSRSRGAEAYLPAELVGLILDNLAGPFGELVAALASTGARPAELTQAVARNYDRERRAIVHLADEQHGYVWKNARKKQHGQRDRVIYLDEVTEAVVARNARRGGWLFPTVKGVSFGEENILSQWRRVKEKKPVAEWLQQHEQERLLVVPYSLRHTWITNALKKGQSIKLVADLCGTSVEMIERHYSHVTIDTDAMRTAFLACR